MAFQQVTVENRVSEFPSRRTLTREDNTTEIVTVTRNEGNVSTEGTAWGAAYANDLESRINTETNLLETNFGHVETNTTASKSYSVGETLVLNGQMYKVTAAIAQGATLVVGTNIAVHSVSAINSNLGGTTFSVTADGAYVHYTPTGGADPVVKKLGESTLDLLWTNPSPTANFAAQTITLDLSKYSHVAILPYDGSSNTMSVIKVGESGNLFNYSNNATTTHKRAANVQATGIVFGSGQYVQGTGTGGNTQISTYDYYGKPYKIYGVKLA